MLTVPGLCPRGPSVGAFGTVLRSVMGGIGDHAIGTDGGVAHLTALEG